MGDQITAKYPSISKGWLLTGEGEMFIDTPPATGIPFYGIDAVDIVQIPQAGRPQPNFQISIPPLQDCHLAALVTGVAMQPDIPAGAMVVLQQVDVKRVIPGEAYVIISEDFKGLRIIRRTENPTELLLIARNSELYDPINIEQQHITHIYRVRAIINVKN